MKVTPLFGFGSTHDFYTNPTQMFAYVGSERGYATLSPRFELTKICRVKPRSLSVRLSNGVSLAMILSMIQPLFKLSLISPFVCSMRASNQWTKDIKVRQTRIVFRLGWWFVDCAISSLTLSYASLSLLYARMFRMDPPFQRHSLFVSLFSLS
jgi:hypothetical protein